MAGASNTLSFWDIFVVTLIVTIAIMIPVVSYLGSRVPMVGRYVEGFEGSGDSDVDLRTAQDAEEDLADDDPEETKKILKETMMELDGKHANLLKRVMKGDMNADTMKHMFKNNMMPDQVVEKLVNRKMEKFFDKMGSPDEYKGKDGK